MAIAWPTERPWVRKVFGVCHVATVSEELGWHVSNGIVLIAPTTVGGEFEHRRIYSH